MVKFCIVYFEAIFWKIFRILAVGFFKIFSENVYQFFLVPIFFLIFRSFFKNYHLKYFCELLSSNLLSHIFKVIFIYFHKRNFCILPLKLTWNFVQIFPQFHPNSPSKIVILFQYFIKMFSQSEKVLQQLFEILAKLFFLKTFLNILTFFLNFP